MSFFKKFPWSLTFLWLFYTVSHSQRITYCSLHYYDAIWSDAVDKCVEENKSLLCYKSQEEIQRVVDRFFRPPLQKNELKFWLSSNNCSSLNESTPCLAVHINRNETDVWHFMQVSCVDPLPFFCCTIEEEASTTVTSQTIEVTTSSLITTVSVESTETDSSASTTESTKIPTNPDSSSTETTYFSTTSENTVSIETTTSLPVCKSVRRRGLLWPDTLFGSSVTLPCPGDSVGNATWSCTGPSGTWSSENPDMSCCRSTKLQRIKEMFEEMPANATIDALTNLFKDLEVLQGNDVQDAVSLLFKLPDKLFRETLSANATVRWQIAQQSVTQTASMFDSMMELETWTDISSMEVPKVGSRMLAAADHFGFFLVDAMRDEQHHSIIKNNLAIEVLKEDYGQTISLPLDLGEHSKHGHITLNSGYDNSLHPDKGPISVIYIYYSDMSNILRAESTGLLNSPVVSLSISQSGLKPVAVKSHVHVLVEHLHESANNSACVFWNMNLHTWDPTGCHLKNSNATHTLCECDHLTNFAVLMDYKGILTDVDDKILFYITVIGCSISIVSLAICVAIFTCFRWKRRNAWGVRYSIHRNLCLTLFFANVLLLAGLNHTENQTVCAVIAGFLHYLFLSAFSWMLLEGVHIYILLIIIFSQKHTHCLKYYVFGYGFPLVVVAITAALRPNSYGTKDRCWLAVDKGAMWSFAGPVACIILVNSAALMLAQLKASKMSPKDDGILIIKRWLRITFILFPLLGLTWVLGFFFVGKEYRIAAYLFALLNSLQGFCIFICHCMMDKNARSMITDCIRKKIATMDTESSGSNKRFRRDTNRHLLSRSSSSRRAPSTSHAPRRRWSLLRRPWAFCVTLKLGKVEPTSECEVATVLQWRKLQETNAL